MRQNDQRLVSHRLTRRPQVCKARYKGVVIKPFLQTAYPSPEFSHVLGGQESPEAIGLVVTHRIHQHHACHLIRMFVGEQPDVHSAHGMANEHVRGRLTSVLQKGVELPRHLTIAVRESGGAIAVPQPGAIVSAGATESSDLGLDSSPDHALVPQPGIKHDDGRSFARAVNVEREATHINPFIKSFRVGGSWRDTRTTRQRD